MNGRSSIEGAFTYSCCSVVSRWCQKAPVGVRGSFSFFCFCRTFLSGGTWIRTGDTMIFSRNPHVLACSTLSAKSTLLRGFLGFAEEGLSAAY